MRGRKVVVLSVGIAALLAALVLFGHPRTLLNEAQTILWPHQFSTAAWAEHPDQRYHMALDLAAGGVLRGKAKPWLLETLGQPQGADPYSDPMTGDIAGTLLYWDAPSPQRPGDRLHIFVDLRGIVSSWGVTHDHESAMIYE